MKLFLTIFILLGLLSSPAVFAEDSNGAAPAADAGSDGKKDKKAAEEEPDCD